MRCLCKYGSKYVENCVFTLEKRVDIFAYEKAATAF